MIINKLGAEFEADCKHFTIGGEIWVNESSDWNGLHGYVTEIRTDGDRETENEGPDIYCDFDAPESEIQIAELERRFSTLYQTEKKLEELPLDCVIMQPEELEPVSLSLPHTDKTLYTLTCWTEKDGEDGMEPHTLGVSTSKDHLLRLMSVSIVEMEVTVILESTAFYGDCMEFTYSEKDIAASDALLRYAIAPTPYYTRNAEVAA